MAEFATLLQVDKIEPLSYRGTTVSKQERQKLIQLFKDKCTDKYVILNDIELYPGDGLHYTIKGQQQVFEAVKKVFD